MVFFAVLEISLSSDFSKINLNLVFGKILVLELWVRVLSANQIVRFCNILWIKCEMKLIFCMQINLKVFYELVLPFLWAWSGMLTNSKKVNISERTWWIVLMVLLRSIKSHCLKWNGFFKSHPWIGFF